MFDATVARTILVTRGPAPRHAARGVEVWRWRTLPALLRRLGEAGLLHLMVEGGAETHASFLRGGWCDELLLFMAPKLFGRDGLTWSGGLGIASPSRALQLEELRALSVGPDVMLSALCRPRRG